MVLAWFGFKSLEQAMDRYHVLLLHFPRNLMTFVDVPTLYNFFQIFPIAISWAFLGIGIGVLWYFLRNSRRLLRCTRDYAYSGIPTVPGWPLLGIAHRLFTINHKTDIHDEALKLVQEYGPIMQFDLFGKHFVMINDGLLARQVLTEVRGKGSFQVSIIDVFMEIALSVAYNVCI